MPEAESPRTQGDKPTIPPDVPLPRPQTQRGAWLYGILAFLALYLFIVAIKLMGHGLKTAATDPATEARISDMFAFAFNPFVGLCIGVLVTSIVQSSSFTTSMTVVFVGAGQLELAQAIPIVMGANIGTSVTNLVVSLGHVRRRMEFRRALAGACVHDFFNVCSVLLFFPLELAFGIFSRPIESLAGAMSQLDFFRFDPTEHVDVVGTAVWPFLAGADWLITDLLNLPCTWAGGLMALAAILLLFVALTQLVRCLRKLVLNRVSELFRNVLFGRPWTSFAVGATTTTLVQSSSVTTSLAVPLVGAGVLNIYQIYPYTLGANIGTTFTSLLAALANAQSAHGAQGVATGLAHLAFNLAGVAVFWPLQQIPISMAQAFARMACRRRWTMAVFLIGMFFALPILVITIAALVT
ncbi:MAG: Na/Pi symporter [Phycisphaerae bacterium]